MSLVRTDYGETCEIFVGSQKTFELTILDPDDPTMAKNLSDATVFATGNFKIVRPNGTLIATLTVDYFDRPNGIIQFEVTTTETVLANAGNWKGELELINDQGIPVEQQVFNFNILESH